MQRIRIDLSRLRVLSPDEDAPNAVEISSRLVERVLEGVLVLVGTVLAGLLVWMFVQGDDTPSIAYSATGLSAPRASTELRPVPILGPSTPNGGDPFVGGSGGGGMGGGGAGGGGGEQGRCRLVSKDSPLEVNVRAYSGFRMFSHWSMNQAKQIHDCSGP
jgi:hypothetical protein